MCLIARISWTENLKFPELEFLGGWSYPYTVALMICSALVPMWYFRKRGWLK